MAYLKRIKRNVLRRNLHFTKYIILYFILPFKLMNLPYFKRYDGVFYNIYLAVKITFLCKISASKSPKVRRFFYHLYFTIDTLLLTLINQWTIKK